MTSLPIPPALPGASADDADRVLAELHVAGRRLDRVAEVVAGFAGTAPLGPWARTHRSCLAAVQAVKEAARGVPEIAPGAVRARGWLIVGALRVNPTGRVALFEDAPLPLAGKELDLLARLAADPYTVVEKATLYRDVWGVDTRFPRTRTIDSHASKLRRRLAEAGAPTGEWIVNSWGRGYSLRPPVRAALQEVQA